MDIDLDERLAAPGRGESSPAETAALARLIDDTERVVFQRRRRWVIRAGAAAVTVAVVGGAGAAAAGALGWDGHGWWDDAGAVTHVVSSGSDQPCRTTYAPRAQLVDGHRVPAADREAAMAAARQFLRTFDYASIDALSPMAAYQELNSRLAHALARQGLPTEVVGVAQATDCETGTGQ